MKALPPVTEERCSMAAWMTNPSFQVFRLVSGLTIYVCVCVGVCVRVCICIYYIYTYIYMYMCICTYYIYTYIYTNPSLQVVRLVSGLAIYVNVYL